MAADLRVALYYAPAADDPLWQAGAAWLGRDPDTDGAVVQPDLPDVAAVTADPRRYGFHATLKPPMRLREGVAWDDVVRSAEALAIGAAPFALPPLAVVDHHGFLALRETVPSPELQALSDLCVAAMDHLREPPSEAEMARRRRGGLAPKHEAMLVRWGYPYVFTTWFFHMTLTRRLGSGERAVFQPAAETFFADAVAQTRRVADVCLFAQRDSGAAFTLAERIPLRG